MAKRPGDVSSLSCVEFSEFVFSGIDLLLNGPWPEQAEIVKSLEWLSSMPGMQFASRGSPTNAAVQNSDSAWSPAGLCAGVAAVT